MYYDSTNSYYNTPWYNSRGQSITATLDEGITSIGFNALYQCEGLRSVYLPNSLRNIASLAFNGCRALSDVYDNGMKEERAQNLSIVDDNISIYNAT